MVSRNDQILGNLGATNATRLLKVLLPPFEDMNTSDVNTGPGTMYFFSYAVVHFHGDRGGRETSVL